MKVDIVEKYNTRRCTFFDKLFSIFLQDLQNKMKFSRIRGAILVLAWTFLPFAVYGSPIPQFFVNKIILAAVGAVSLPIAGWLSDIMLGRYRIICISMWIMWISLIAGNILLAVYQYTNKPLIVKYVAYIPAVFVVLGMTGAMGNTLQFGIDQLTEASSSDISSYITWYTWIIFFAITSTAFTQSCLCGKYSATVSFLILPFLSTLLLVSDTSLNHWLLKEPVTNNPFKLIFQVLKYAVKNKHPRLRSAFTYWEDKPYSRIDLGKAKYGGPFSTEQVEDVKTFFRLLAFIAASSPLPGIIYVIFTTEHTYVLKSFQGTCSNEIQISVAYYMLKCSKRIFIGQSPYLIIVMTLPIIHFIVCPLLRKCCHLSEMRIVHKTLLAIILLLLCELSLLILEVVLITKSDHRNATSCFFNAKKNDDYVPMNYKRLAIPQCFLGLAVYLSFSGTLTFVYAQSPYSLKGLLVSIIYMMYGLSVAFSIGIVQLLEVSTGHLDAKCGTWYYTSLICSTFVVLCLQVLAIKLYTYRKRDETLSNDHMFAVDYFDKYLSNSSSTSPSDNLKMKQ